MRNLGLILAGLAAAPLILSQQASELEARGDSRGARRSLERAAQGSPSDAAAQLEYASFLDRHHDPQARAAYEKALAVSAGKQKQAAARRLVILGLLAGDTAAAQK